MNILCLKSRIIGSELALELVLVFLSAEFSSEERHRRRLEKILDIERQSLQGQ
jgi:ribose 5-phosphate isomerase B